MKSKHIAYHCIAIDISRFPLIYFIGIFLGKMKPIFFSINKKMNIFMFKIKELSITRLLKKLKRNLHKYLWIQRILGRKFCKIYNFRNVNHNIYTIKNYFLEIPFHIETKKIRKFIHH